MKFFVTGGTGLLGNTIVRQLSDAGHQVIALVRQSPEQEIFAGANVELVEGDLSSEAVIDATLARCDACIHAAGLIHLGWTRLEASMRVNRDGTRVLVDACHKHDRKLVHVGTVNVVAVGSRQSPVDESTPWDANGGQVPCAYVLSKRAGVEEVLNGVKRGLRAVIVHPGFMLGPWDWKPSSGRMMLEVGRMWRPLAPPGGCSACDSRDVAEATIAAVERGGDEGRQFILAGHNVTYKELWSEMATRMGTRPPLMTFGPVPNWVGGVAGDLRARWTGRESDINSAAIKMSCQFHWYHSDRARDELGYRTRDLSESLDASAEWIKSHHLH